MHQSATVEQCPFSSFHTVAQDTNAEQDKIMIEIPRWGYDLAIHIHWQHTMAFRIAHIAQLTLG